MEKQSSGMLKDTRKVTSKDVSREAGVSQSLVSLILNNIPGKKIKPETRKLVLETSERLGYRVNINARNMKSSRAGAIGLLSTWNEDSFVFPPVIKGVKTVCANEDMAVVLCSGKRDSGEYDFVDYYYQSRIDGLIFISWVGVKQDGIIETLMKNNIPFVCIIGARDLENVSCVDVNFIKSGYMAAWHLANRNCKSILYLIGDSPKELNYAETERIKGAEESAEENSISLEISRGAVNNEKLDELAGKFNNIMKSGKYDGIIASSPICYFLLKVAVKYGIKIPKDIKVISIDNELFAPYLYPALTTVDQPFFEMGARAAELLMKKINGFSGCEKIELDPNVTERETT